MTERQYELISRLSTTNLSDALDFYKLKGAVHGILPTWEGCTKVFGEAVTVRMIAAGETPPKNHLGYAAIHAAEKGNVVVVDNAGRKDISCWGGVLATAAKMKGISGVLIDGYCRDIDDYIDLGFSVYSRGIVVQSARGRAIEEATNVTVQFGNVQVHPGDFVMGDRSGVVIVPKAHIDEVLEKATQLLEKEEAMCADLKAGMDAAEVDLKYSYNTMLSK